MEYVDAVSAPEFLSRANSAEVLRFSASVTAAVKFLGSCPALVESRCAPGARLAEKARQVAMHAGVGGSSLSVLAGALEKADFEVLQTQTLCHGDLSLENILVEQDGRLVLIDFLDGPWSHFLLDVSKLHVDILAHWYARHRPRISEWVMLILRESLLSFAPVVRHEAFLRPLLALDLARILPYTQSSSHRLLLTEQIKHQLQFIEKEGAAR
jgi:hypothetical protein